MDRRDFLKGIPLLGIAPLAISVALEPPPVKETQIGAWMFTGGATHEEEATRMIAFVKSFNAHNPEVRLIYKPYPALTQADPLVRDLMMEEAKVRGYIPSGTIGWKRPASTVFNGALTAMRLD